MKKEMRALFVRIPPETRLDSGSGVRRLSEKCFTGRKGREKNGKGRVSGHGESVKHLKRLTHSLSLSLSNAFAFIPVSESETDFL